MQSAARYIGLVVRAFDLRLEIAGSIPAAALSSAYSHIQGGPKSKPLPNDQNGIKSYQSRSMRLYLILKLKYE